MIDKKLDEIIDQLKELNRNLSNINGGSYDERVHLAQVSTDKQLLDRLSKDGENIVRYYVAENTNTAPTTLNNMRLVEKAYKIRMAIAKNPSIDYNTLYEMRKDGDDSVLAAVAQNLNAGNTILDYLKTYKNSLVRLAVAENEHVSSEILDYLKDDKVESVRKAVAQNKNSDVDILDYLKSDKSHHVRQAISENPNTSEKTLEALKNDENGFVKRDAEYRLLERTKND